MNNSTLKALAAKVRDEIPDKILEICRNLSMKTDGTV